MMLSDPSVLALRGGPARSRATTRRMVAVATSATPTVVPPRKKRIVFATDEDVKRVARCVIDHLL